MKSYFNNLFKYNHWANQECFKGIEEAENPPEKVIELFSHIQSAQIIWLHRIKELPTAPFPVWEVYNLRELKSMLEEGSARWLKFINEYPDENFEQTINYKDSTGDRHQSKVADIITHVINHGTYHRGQIAMIMRNEELSPAITDFIVYTRD